MRVAMVVPTDAAGPWRSIENYAENISHGLARWEVARAEAPGFPVWNPRRLEHGRLRRSVAGADIVHLAHHSLMPFARRLARPVIVTVHDVIPQLFQRSWRGRLWAWRLDRQMRGLDLLPLVIANSDCTRRDTLARFPVAPSRIRVIPVAVHPDFYEPPPAAHTSSERPFVLSIGEAAPHKGLPVLIAALSDDLLRNLELVRVGAPLTPRQTELARTLGVAGRIRQMGRISQEELRGLFATAVALVQPSQYEGFGMPVAEAFAAGTPVVCSDGGALAEVAGGAAAVVPLNGADVRSPAPDRAYVEAFAATLSRVVEDVSLRADLTGRGRERARAFHPHAVGPQVEEAYEATVRLWSSRRS